MTATIGKAKLFGMLEEKVRLNKENRIKNVSFKEETEEKNMAESQSRYGIMEQLNNRKLNEKEKLANLEQEKRSEVSKVDKDMVGFNNSLAAIKCNYKENHAAWKRNELLEKSRLESELKEKIVEITDKVSEADENLETKHKKDVNHYETQIKFLKDEHKSWLEKQDAKVESKKETITEIENAIKDLKEMSKEQTGKSE